MNRFRMDIDLEKIIQSLKTDKSLKRQAMIIQSILNEHIDTNILFAHYMDSKCYELALKDELKMLFRKMDSSNDPNEKSTYPTYCLTTGVDENVIWQLYTKEATGAMHKLALDDIDALANEYPILFGPIFYMDETKEIISILDNLEGKYGVNKLKELFLNFCKKDSWKHEMEYRMLYITDESEVSIPSDSFKELTLMNIDPKRESDKISKHELSKRRMTGE